MDAMGWVLLVVAYGCATLCAVMAMRARRQSAALREQHRLQLEQLERVRRALELAHWQTWWIRNAAEPFPRADPQRADQLRYALASVFAPSPEAFIRRMHSVSTDDAKSQNERLAAAAFVGEWEVAQQTNEVPWQKFTRETGRTELYAAGRMDQLFRDAVGGWDLLLGGPVRLVEATGNCPAHEAEQH